METQSLDKLEGILKQLEMQESNPELEKINDLIKVRVINYYDKNVLSSIFVLIFHPGQHATQSYNN